MIVKEIVDSAAAQSVELALPVDFVVSDKSGEDGEIKTVDIETDGGVPDGFMGLDCGP